jgi:putative DNA primase/helicase
VLVLDGEMPAAVLQERLARIAELAPNEPPGTDYLRFLAHDMQERDLDLSSGDDQQAIEAEIGSADMVIVDNISTLTRGGRENEAESWLPVQQWALRQRRRGRSVLFIHHAGKGGQQRGTSRREDVLDTVIAMRLPSDHQSDEGARFEVYFEKSRGFCGDDAKPFEAALGASGWTTRDLADVDMARVMVLTGQGLSVRDIAEETGIPKSRVHRLQAKARELGLTGMPGNA